MCLTPLNVPIDRTFTLRSVVRCGAGFGTHTVMLVRTGTLVAVDAPLLCVMNLGVTGELDIDADQARGIPEDRRPSSGQELVLDPDCAVSRSGGARACSGVDRCDLCAPGPWSDHPGRKRGTPSHVRPHVIRRLIGSVRW